MDSTDGWQIYNSGIDRAITISSLTGDNFSSVILTVAGNAPSRNPTHLEVNHGSVTASGANEGAAVTIDNINSSSVTLKATTATDFDRSWTFSKAMVLGSGRVAVNLNDTDDPDVKTFTMPRGPVQIDAKFDVYVKKAYPLWVGATQVTEDNKSDILGDGGKATFDSATNTLTLDDPVVEKMYESKAGWTACIYTQLEDTLVIKGKASLTNPDSGAKSMGIYAGSANGSDVELNGMFKVKSGYYSIGARSITFAGGNVKLDGASGARAKEINILAGTVRSSSESHPLIGTTSITISDDLEIKNPYHGKIGSIDPNDDFKTVLDENDAAVMRTTIAPKDAEPSDVFTVTFKDGFGKTLKIETVEKSGSVKPPAKPVKEGLIFDGWSRNFDNVDEDFDVYAQWKPYPSKYGLWVGSTPVNDDNLNDILKDGGKAKFDPASNTLTLNNPTIKIMYVDRLGWNACINSVMEAPLVIKGKAVLKNDAHSSNSNGIRANGAVELNGNFTIKSSYHGIAADSMTISGGTINIDSPVGIATTKKIKINDGTVKPAGATPIVAYCGTLV